MALFIVVTAVLLTLAHAQESLVHLKHRELTGYRNSTIERRSAPKLHPEHRTTDHTTEHPKTNDIHDEDPVAAPSDKQSRSGIGLQKSPPDLQFGLAFTVPFVSLSTEKLLNSVHGKNYDGGFNGVSSLLKLNLSGLLLAALVGIIAAAGLFLPSILGNGGHPFLDNLIPHFTDHQYNDYENGWSKPGWKHADRRTRANDISASVFKYVDQFRSSVGKFEKCVINRLCVEHGNGTVTNLLKPVVTNKSLDNISVVKIARNIFNNDYSPCKSVGEEFCDQFKQIEAHVHEFVKVWDN